MNQKIIPFVACTNILAAVYYFIFCGDFLRELSYKLALLQYQAEPIKNVESGPFSLTIFAGNETYLLHHNPLLFVVSILILNLFLLIANHMACRKKRQPATQGEKPQDK